MSDSMAPLADMPEFTHTYRFQQSCACRACRRGIYRYNPELCRVGRYSSGTFNDRRRDLRNGASYYNGTEYRHLRDGSDIKYRRQQKRKKVAAVHLSFNIIGTLICLIPFCILDAVFDFSFTHMAINPFMIAVCHSIFNVVTTAVLMPFTKTA